MNLDESQSVQTSEHLLIECVFHFGELHLCILRVFHDFGVVACIDHHGYDPFGVLQSGPSQDEVAVVQVQQLRVQLLDRRP